MVTKCIKDIEKELKFLKLEVNRLNSKPEKESNKINKLKQEIKELEEIKKRYKEDLSELNDLGFRIYYQILFEGLSSTKAIEKISQENYDNNIKPYSVSRLWVYYKIYVKPLLNDSKKE